MATNYNEIDKRLWEAADELRANSKLKSSEYSVPVLGLIFLQYADYKFNKLKNELEAKHSGRSISKLHYQAGGVLYLPEKARFAAGPHKRTRAEQLRHALESKIEKMVEVNRSRVDYQEQLERMIEEYNKSTDVETLLKQLFSLTEELEKEDARAVAEGFTEEELAIYDLLARSEASLSETEKQQVKKVTRVLLQRLKDKLVIDWRKKQQSRATVKLSIEECLDHLPREADDRKMVCQAIYQHVYDSYFGEGTSVYVSAGD